MECPEYARTKLTAALGSMKGRVLRVGVILNLIQSKVVVVVKLTLEGMQAVEKAKKEKRCHLSKVR